MADEPKKDDKPAEAPAGKTFNLKPIETQLLVIVHNNQQAVFSAILSTFATERLGYAVTERTQFKLNAEMNEIEISEIPAPPVPVAAAEGEASTTTPDAPPAPPTPPAEEPASGAVAAA